MRKTLHHPGGEGGRTGNRTMLCLDVLPAEGI